MALTFHLFLPKLAVLSRSGDWRSKISALLMIFRAPIYRENWPVLAPLKHLMPVHIVGANLSFRV